MRKLLFLIPMAFSLHAKDYGKMGEVYPIQERSIIDLLTERLEGLSEEKGGEISKYMQSRIKEYLHTPKEVPGIRKTTKYKVHYIDPTITTKQDIIDHEGKVIVPKGTEYNPLNSSALNQPLLLIDGTDPLQVAWARQERGVWILTKGKPLKLEEEEGIPVYFDQGGVLCKKFKIEAVPSKVENYGNIIKIMAIPVDKPTD